MLRSSKSEEYKNSAWSLVVWWWWSDRSLVGLSILQEEEGRK